MLKTQLRLGQDFLVQRASQCRGFWRANIRKRFHSQIDKTTSLAYSKKEGRVPPMHDQRGSPTVIGFTLCFASICSVFNASAVSRFEVGYRI
jgi:hypothetical protein